MKSLNSVSPSNANQFKIRYVYKVIYTHNLSNDDAAKLSQGAPNHYHSMSKSSLSSMVSPSDFAVVTGLN